MSTIYEDLYRKLGGTPPPSVEGTWGPTSGFLGYINPGSRDYGTTEALREASGKRPSAEVTTSYNNPAVYQNLVSSGAPLPAEYYSSTPDRDQTLGATDTTSTSTGDSGDSDDSGDPGPSEAEGVADLLRQAQEAARQKYATLMSNIEEEYSRAQRRRDEAMGMVSKRQEEFGRLRDEDLLNISDTFEGQKGGARRTASDLALQAGNRARAMGMQNMSSALGVPSRMDEALYRQMGNINQERGRNDRAAQRLYDQRQDWATGQLGNIRDSFEQAGSARNMAGQLNATSYAQDISGLENAVGGYMNNLVAQQNALAAAKAGAQGYESNPYGIDMAGLQNTLSAFQPGVAQQAEQARTEAANVQNPRLLDQIRQNQPIGGNLYQGLA